MRTHGIRKPRLRRTARSLLSAASCIAMLAAGSASAQVNPADRSVPPIQWARVAAANEEHIIKYDNGELLRYKVDRKDAKGEVLRQVIESKEGSVARLLAHNGQPLTAEENTAERDRLQGILESPDAFLRRVQRDEGSKSYATELLHSMPGAMLWSYAPGQPQLPGVSGAQVVLDFKPDPKFKPPSLITEALTGIEGRVWVDASSRCVLRIQGQILHPVDFGWGGVLARIREGGYVEMDQRPAGEKRWLYAHLIERITIREVMVHTVQENVELRVSDVAPLPAPVSFREAVQQLLAIPVATR